MAHQYQYLFDEWAQNGVKNQPTTELIDSGFVGGKKPQASVFNYQWDKIGKAISELQETALTEIDTSSLATVATSGSYNDLTNKPTFHKVATSGKYSDLTGTPTIATVATTGSYNDLTDQPSTSDSVKYESGSYVGTGTGSFTLSFSFTPKIVSIVGVNDNTFTESTIIYGVANGQNWEYERTSISYSICSFNTAWGTNSVAFSGLFSGSGVYALNRSGFTYTYLAIG